MQSSLFAPPATNGFRDSSFSKNKDLPLHRWVPWIAGFSADFVADSIERYLPGRREDCWVLDPFAGVGTTLVEAYLNDLNVLGFEINPYAALATKIKLNAVKLSLSELKRQIGAFERVMEKVQTGTMRRGPRSKAPSGFSGRTQLFSPQVQRKVLYVLDFLGTIKDPAIRDLFRLGLGSVMVSVSNYSYEPSLTRRAAVDKPDILDANVGLVVSTKLRLMAEDVAWVQGHNLGSRPKARVVAASIFSAPLRLKRRNFVDLLITSPPYLNNYHYPRNTRPQLHWLGFTAGTGYKGARETESFGKFWQTVRDLEPIPLAFKMPELSEIIQSIKDRNVEKGCYGGPGWANYVTTYFNDTYTFCGVLSQLLRPNAASIIVLGNSIIQGVEVKTDEFFGKIGELWGLKFEDNHLLRNKRTGSSIIQSSVRVGETKEKTVLYESGVVLRKAS